MSHLLFCMTVYISIVNKCSHLQLSHCSDSALVVQTGLPFGSVNYSWLLGVYTKLTFFFLPHFGCGRKKKIGEKIGWSKIWKGHFYQIFSPTIHSLSYIYAFFLFHNLLIFISCLFCIQHAWSSPRSLMNHLFIPIQQLLTLQMLCIHKYNYQLFSVFSELDMVWLAF